MTSSTAGGSGSSRRFAWLAAAIVFALAAYAAGWHYLADRLLGQVQSGTARLERAGLSAECAGASVRGFPFRMGLFCDRLAFADAAAGVNVSTGGFRSAAQVYEPTRLVGEVDGPAEVTLPQIGPVTLAWESLRASTKLASPLPQRGSAEAVGVSAMRAGTALFSFGRGMVHMRSRDGDLDLAASVETLALAPPLTGAAAPSPPLRAEAELTVEDGVALAAAGADSLRGISGRLGLLRLAGPDGGTIALSGPFAVDEAGLLDATLTVAVTEAPAIAKLLGTLFPEERERIDSALSGLAALGGAASLPLTVRKGRAALGFIPLGEIPPL